MNLMSKIKSRLGGNLYNRIRTLSKYERNFVGGGGIEQVFKFMISGVNKTLKIKFFFGSAAEKIAVEAFVENLHPLLYENYSTAVNSEHFDFDGIILPKLSKNERSVELGFCRMLPYYIIQDVHLADALSDEGPYEYGSVQIENGDIVFDCGANLGIFSAIACYKGAAAVYAFEPNQVVIESLLSGTATHNPNIHICNFALSNKKEELEFAFNYDHFSGGALSMVNPGSAVKKSVTATVNAITLDEFVFENKIERVDFIKADIEGAERYMLMGAKQVLKKFAPKLAICTYHLPDDPKVLRKIILEANPNYVIEEKYKKMYAYVPNR